ncbi:LacI family DNA-binding transcriptional regulator [Ruminococcus sp. NK3A76]|uniref:LacI family DNA-binding transcriptional regulator n=1 Tax=Ruminococcus sp. NK3A76 TaxID=877411 RepID=UPI0004903E5E|nr:LacI family DNA-binding transcriptional regulator [Ruminococcus sp. NK3A76]
MSVTIKDVAREAGVSVATVSRVLNGSANVSEASSKLVHETVQRLGYSPNFLGRNLRKRETNVILVIMPTSEHSLYGSIISGMQEYASTLGYDIISSAYNNVSANEIRQMNMLFNRTVDGAVLLGTSLSAEKLNEIARNYDIALCCEGVEGADVLTVAVDDEQAGYDAAKVLVGLGHKRIGLICVDSASVSSRKRENGYLRALADSGIEVKNEYIWRGTYEAHNGADAMEHFMSLDEKPTALFAVSDLLAVAACKKAQNMGLTVGKDISVMGFDNISMCEMFTPTLSTVSQPCRKMGEFVARKLIENFGTANKDKKFYHLGHDVIIRESTGKI